MLEILLAIMLAILLIIQQYCWIINNIVGNIVDSAILLKKKKTASLGKGKKRGKLSTLVDRRLTPPLLSPMATFLLQVRDGFVL